MLVNLKNRFAPSDSAREQELVLEWKKLQNQPQNQDVNIWLHQWETLYDECKAEGIPDVQDNRPIHAFLDAISTIAPSFADTWDIKLLEGIVYDFPEVVRKFRDYRRNTQNRQKLRGEHSAFTATLQGREPTTLLITSSNDQKATKQCICGEIHYYKDCYYFIESKRPKDWQPDKAIQDKIDQKLRNDKKFYDRIEFIRLREAKNASDSTELALEDSTSTDSTTTPTLTSFTADITTLLRN
jgi:hypothetical protein